MGCMHSVISVNYSKSPTSHWMKWHDDQQLWNTNTRGHSCTCSLKTPCPYILKLDPNGQMMILLGTDMIWVHKVRQQVNGPHDAPFAQRLDLEWVIVDEVCIDNTHKSSVSVFKTHTLQNGQPSLFTPCHNSIDVKEKPRYSEECRNGLSTHTSKHQSWIPARAEGVWTYREPQQACYVLWEWNLSDTHGGRSPSGWNEQLGCPLAISIPLSPTPKQQGVSIVWVLEPRTWRCSRSSPPSWKSCSRISVQRVQWMLVSAHHPQKPGQIRVVFDSNAQQHGVSLNPVLLTGPELNNTLLGVLLWFRKELVAVSADIQQMFFMDS